MKYEAWEELSDQQCEMVVGGVGSGPFPGAGKNGWGIPGTPSGGHGLFSAGFVPGPLEAGNSGQTITVPGRPE